MAHEGRYEKAPIDVDQPVQAHGIRRTLRLLLLARVADTCALIMGGDPETEERDAANAATLV